MVASLVAAVVAAVCYGVASVMQAIAARAASHRPAAGTPGQEGSAPPGLDPGLLVRMLGQWRFVASLGLDTLGFLGQLIALHRLPLQQRVVVVLHYYVDLDVSSIAVELGIPEGTVKSRLARARASLGPMMTEELQP